jgi:type IV secretory pathway VirB2 component (pilin)
MSSLQIAVSVALVLVIVKFIASLLGKGNIPLLNQAVTVILSLFIAFELFQLGQALYQSQL